MAPVLPDGWEAVAAEDGRTYYWNVNTNETVWEAPTTAHSPIAASFLSMAAASSESGRQAAAGILNTSSGSSEGGSTPTSESGRSKALGVDAMRKYREAKEAEAKASHGAEGKAEPDAGAKAEVDAEANVEAEAGANANADAHPNAETEEEPPDFGDEEPPDFGDNSGRLSCRCGVKR